MLYFSTGNASPNSGGDVRKGDNLFSASIVALDYKTGQYKWHFQEVHHDLWDFDAPSPVVLFDQMYNGQMRKGLYQAGKTGWLYFLDRTNGQPLIGIDEKPVPQEPRTFTSATQPYPGGRLVHLPVPGSGARVRAQWLHLRRVLGYRHAHAAHGPRRLRVESDDLRPTDRLRRT